MSTQVLAQKPNPPSPPSMQQLLETFKPQIQAALPKHLTPDRMARIALTEYRKISPKIQAALDPISFLGAIVQSAQLGLEPGSGLGQSYLVPFKNGKRSQSAGRDVYEIQLMIGFRGKITLARNSKELLSIGAYEVRANDKFEYRFGADHPPVHVPPPLNQPRGEMIGVWADAKLIGGGYQFVVLDLETIERARKASRSGNSGPWMDHYEEMAKKTAVHRLSKMLPVSVEVRELGVAAELETLAEQGVSQNHQALIDAAFTPDYTPTENIQTLQGGVAADQAEDRRVNLIGRLKESIVMAKDRINATDAEICRRLQIEKPADIEGWAIPKLDATIDAVADWGQ